jgi:hypothetical protein
LLIHNLIISYAWLGLHIKLYACSDVHLKMHHDTVRIAAHDDSCSAFSVEGSADASKVGESDGVSSGAAASTTGGLGWTENAAAAGWNLAT